MDSTQRDTNTPHVGVESTRTGKRPDEAAKLYGMGVVHSSAV